MVEVYWCTVHHGRLKPGQATRLTFTRYLARGGKTDLSYSFPALLKHAKVWELDLVIEIETRAARIRRSLREISKLATHLRTLQQLADYRLRRAAPTGGGTPAPSVPIEMSHPSVMPTPPSLLPPDGNQD